MKSFILSLLTTCGICSSCNAEKITQLSPQEYANAVTTDTTAVILDVRRPDEFAAGHLKNALLLDFLNTKAFRQGIEQLDKEKTYYIYCRSGRRSANAATTMQKLGFRVVEMRGGIEAWKAENLPLDYSK